MRRLIPGSLVLSLALAVTSSLCADKAKDPVVGSYEWQTNGGVVIRADGTVTYEDSDHKIEGRWVVNPTATDGYVIMWDNGYVLSLRLTEVNKVSKLEGTALSPEGKTHAILGTRRK